VADETEKYEGEHLKIGNKVFIVPSLTVKQARDLWPKIINLNKGIDETNLPEKHRDSLEIVLASLKRNYPALTFEELEDMIDLRQMKPVMQAVMGQSGLGPVPGLVPGAAPKSVS
jgi:hypothetical protein